MNAAQDIIRHFAACLDRAAAKHEPFAHWLLTDALPDEVAHAIPALPLAPPEIGDTLGKRETHNSTRNFFSVENRARFPVCEAVASAFQAPETVRRLEQTTGIALTGSSLRIEYCQDRDGFWLEPHTDIGVKLFTMLVYLSDVPEAEGWGTDIYDASKRHLGSAPGGFDKGIIFIPADDSWHGVAKRDFNGVRKSIIVNYVRPEWRARHELAFPDQPIA